MQPSRPCLFLSCLSNKVHIREKKSNQYVPICKSPKSNCLLNLPPVNGCAIVGKNNCNQDFIITVDEFLMWGNIAAVLWIIALLKAGYSVHPAIIFNHFLLSWLQK